MLSNYFPKNVSSVHPSAVHRVPVAPHSCQHCDSALKLAEVVMETSTQEAEAGEP
jgi:hypothetical protein